LGDGENLKLPERAAFLFYYYGNGTAGKEIRRAGNFFFAKSLRKLKLDVHLRSAFRKAFSNRSLKYCLAD
jgi:hypothetical protein